MKYIVGVIVLAGVLSVPAHAASPNPITQKKQFELAGQKATKLLVDKDGWYRVGFTALRNAGFVVPKTTANLQLWVDGTQVPIKIPRGAIEFYGTALDTQSTDTRTYWLINGKTKGLRMGTTKVGTRGGQPRGSFAATSLAAPRVTYAASIANGEAPNLFGPTWGFGEVANVKVPAPHASTSAPASLRVSVQGLSLVNHIVKVTWNGTVVGNITFKGQILAAATFPIPAGVVKDGDNTVLLAATGGEIDFGFLDFVELNYQHTFVADGDALTFSAPAGRATAVGGFTTKNVRLIDISRPDRPRELIPTRGGLPGNYTATFRPLSSTKKVFAFANYKARAPQLVANGLSTLNASTQSADLVVLTHRDFMPALQTLVELRQREGFKVVVSDVQDVYDEFNFGAKDPKAIKDFLIWTRDHWAKAPHYVLLVGDASNDPKNLLGKGSFDFVPTEFVDTQYLEAPSDDSLADFNADGIPEMAVGRLPVRTIQDATTVVSKLVRYDQAIRPRSVLLVADKPIDYDFEALSQQLAALVPAGVSVSNVFRNQGPTDAAVRSRLIGALNQGPSIVNFYGHGAIQIWTSGSILRHTDPAVLTNANSLSIYLMMTCLNGYFVEPKFDSLGETLLLAPNGGAVATWSSSGETVPTDQVVADQEAVKLLLNQPNMTLGDAMITGKTVIRDIDVRHTWVLLGDPTTRLH